MIVQFGQKLNDLVQTARPTVPIAAGPDGEAIAVAGYSATEAGIPRSSTHYALLATGLKLPLQSSRYPEGSQQLLAQCAAGSRATRPQIIKLRIVSHVQ